MDEILLRNSIKVHRARLNLTQEQLAALVHVSRKTVNTVETGKFVPSTILALKLAQSLHTTVEDLFQLEYRRGQAAPKSILNLE